jgi:hypothetical protein
MAETDITVEGYAEPFSCLAEDEWTVKEAVDAIREAYLLSGGQIKRNGMATKPTHKIREDDGIAYVFVGGEKKQSFPHEGTLSNSLISSTASTDTFFPF